MPLHPGIAQLVDASIPSIVPALYGVMQGWTRVDPAADNTIREPEPGLGPRREQLQRLVVGVVAHASAGIFTRIDGEPSVSGQRTDPGVDPGPLEAAIKAVVNPNPNGGQGFHHSDQIVVGPEHRPAAVDHQATLGQQTLPEDGFVQHVAVGVAHVHTLRDRHSLASDPHAGSADRGGMIVVLDTCLDLGLTSDPGLHRFEVPLMDLFGVLGLLLRLLLFRLWRWLLLLFLHGWKQTG